MGGGGQHQTIYDEYFEDVVFRLYFMRGNIV